MRIESLMLILIQRLMGTRPTTSAMAGMVSGSKQRNSTTRSSTSIAIDVMAASSSDAVMASTRSGVLIMLVQASRVRGAVSLFPRVENSNIAPIGTRKNAPMTRRTATRKTCSLSLRDRVMPGSSQPPRCSSLKQRVQRHHDGDDDDHRQRERLGKTGLRLARLAGEQALDLQRDDDSALGDERRRRCVRGERVREEEQRAPKEGWREQRAGDVAPVVPCVAA